MKMKLEFWVSVTAMITAVAAVVVAIIQTQVMREEAELERDRGVLGCQSPSAGLVVNDGQSRGIAIYAVGAAGPMHPIDHRL